MKDEQRAQAIDGIVKSIRMGLTITTLDQPGNHLPPAVGNLLGISVDAARELLRAMPDSDRASNEQVRSWID